RLALLLLGGFPLAPLEPTVDAHAASPVHVGADALRRRAVDAYVEIVGLLDQRAVGVLTTGVARDPQRAHARARGQRAQLRLAREAADQDRAVDAEVGHCCSPFLARCSPRAEPTPRLGRFSGPWRRTGGQRGSPANAARSGALRA